MSFFIKKSNVHFIPEKRKKKKKKKRRVSAAVDIDDCEIVNKQAASHWECLAVVLHISAHNVKHMLECGWESGERRRGYPCPNEKTPSLSICRNI